MKKMECPFCGYRMPVFIGSQAEAKGLFVKCKGRNCGKIFEIQIAKKEQKTK